MKLYADVNFDGRVIRELRRRGTDIVVAKEDGHGQTSDPDLLDRATFLGRVLCTHDDDLLAEATRRQTAGIPFVGVLFSRQERVPIGVLVEDLLLICEATSESDWQSRVEFLPL